MKGFLPHRPVTALLAVVFCLGAPTLSRAQVVISEFMAVNSNTNIVDEDGSHSDWIELQNNGPAPASLNGWYLTDAANDLEKWRFPLTTPAVTIPPGGRLVVWASNKNRKAVANRLHTDFRLNGGGGFLALVRPDGLTIEHSYAPQYPPQATDTSYGISGGKQWSVLVGPTLASKWKVRTPQTSTEFTTTMANWHNTPAFDDTTWTNAGTGVSTIGVLQGMGYDISGETSYLIFNGNPSGNVQASMYRANNANWPTGTAATLCARIKFNLADPSTVEQMRLNLRFDDGFIVYLNGQKILENNAPATPAWNSPAPIDREDDQLEDFETFALPTALQALVAGDNLLTVHAFNEANVSATISSAVFNLTPQLEAFGPVAGALGGQPGYLATATPGGENTIATTIIGPDISQTTKNPPQPTGGAGSPDLLVTARVRATLQPIASVVCRYTVNFGGEITLPMSDDGTAGDILPGDGIYSASLPTSGLSPGHLLRWRINAFDTAAPQNVSSDPPFRDQTDNDKYFGTMAQTPTIQSQLPVLFWFHNVAAQPPVFSSNKTGFRSMLFFRLPDEASGRFYDNVRINLHGQSSIAFPKKSQNVNFNSDNRFKWRTGEESAPSMNLLSNWADKSHVRNSIIWDLWNRTGHPSHWSQAVRVQQITAVNVTAGVDAQFLGTWDMVEDANEEFLQRWGLDENGALYKCYNSLTDTSQNSSTNNAGVEKKTREFEDFSDLGALVAALNPSLSLTSRRQWVYDNVDIPAMINFLALQAVFMSTDFGHKNYYVYRDTLGSGEWKLLPWDQDLSFGHTWTSPANGGAAYYDDHIDSSKGLAFVGTGNRLMRVILTDGCTELIQMYNRRIKSLADLYLGAPATPSNVVESRIGQFLDTLDPPAWPVTTDAERDFQKWGFWVHGSGTVYPWTDARAVNYRIRPMAGRITTSNANPPYPSANPWTPFGVTSVPAMLPGRRQLLYNGNPTLSGQPLPATQPAAPTLIIQNINFNPGAAGQDQEYFVIRNPNAFAVDLTGWRIAGAGITHIFEPGTVIPAQGTPTSDGVSSTYVNQLIVARKAQAFRQRTQTPKASEYRHIQDGYNGRLSARGGTLVLSRPADPLNPASGYVDVVSQSFAGAPTPAQEFLRVTELNFAPAAPTPEESAALSGVKAGDFEFVELTNTGFTPLDLGGAQFDRGITFTFPTGFTLQPAARVVIVSKTGAFALRYGAGLNVAGEFDGNLDNSGEELRLMDSVGEEVLRFTYSPAWFPAPNGYSLVTRVAATAFDGYNVPTAWALSGQASGTPGAIDSSFSQVFEGWRYDHFSPGELSNANISGWQADPDNDGSGNFAEYVFGHDPREHDGPVATELSVIRVDDSDYLAITFIRRTRALDVTYIPEASPDLVYWSVIDIPVGSPEPQGDGFEKVTFRDHRPLPASRRFLRVRAVK